MRREHRQQLRRMFGHPPVDRRERRDRIALLLPHGFPVTATVRELARDLGTPEIVQNPWPDRLTRAHQAAQAAGHDVSGPVVWVERWVEPPSSTATVDPIEQLGRWMELLWVLAGAEGTDPGAVLEAGSGDAAGVREPLMHLDLSSLTGVIADLPWTELRRAFDLVVASGKGRREAASIVAHVVDQVVDFEKLVPGASGKALESADYALIRGAIVIGLLFSGRGAGN